MSVKIWECLNSIILCCWLIWNIAKTGQQDFRYNSNTHYYPLFYPNESFKIFSEPVQWPSILWFMTTVCVNNVWTLIYVQYKPISLHTAVLFEKINAITILKDRSHLSLKTHVTRNIYYLSTKIKRWRDDKRLCL